MNQPGSRATLILPLMSLDEIEKAVRELITPEIADREADLLIRIINAVANFEEPEQARLALGAINAAFHQTSHYEKVFKAGFGAYLERLEKGELTIGANDKQPEDAADPDAAGGMIQATELIN